MPQRAASTRVFPAVSPDFFALREREEDKLIRKAAAKLRISAGTDEFEDLKDASTAIWVDSFVAELDARSPTALAYIWRGLMWKMSDTRRSAHCTRRVRISDDADLNGSGNLLETYLAMETEDGQRREQLDALEERVVDVIGSDGWQRLRAHANGTDKSPATRVWACRMKRFLREFFRRP